MLERLFPNIFGRWQNTSPFNCEYNCIGHAIQTDKYFIWPDARNLYAWPESLPRNESLDNFIEFFRRAGFSRCATTNIISGIEKIAIYAKSDLVKHAARQLPGHDKWTSKLSDGIDIMHDTAEVLEQGTYGNIAAVMYRIDTGAPPVLPGDMWPPPARLIRPDGMPLVQ